VKAAIYVRVSTEDQDEKNQVEPLQKFADALGLEIFCIYSDKVSGGDSNRPGFKSMMEGFLSAITAALICGYTINGLRRKA
jgi:DNA invertase Pin-like site-specific DNA recombinase